MENYFRGPHTSLPIPLPKEMATWAFAGASDPFRTIIDEQNRLPYSGRHARSQTALTYGATYSRTDYSTRRFVSTSALQVDSFANNSLSTLTEHRFANVHP